MEPAPCSRRKTLRKPRLPESASRRALLASVALAFASGPGLLRAQTVDDLLPLPKWENEPAPAASATSPELGAHFNDLIPPPPELPGGLESGPRLADGPPSVLPGYTALSSNDLSLFLRGGMLDHSSQPGSARPAAHSPTPAMKLREAPADVLRRLEDAPANEHLLDPFDLVSEVTKEDVLRLLEFHASSAQVRLYILVLEADQKLPAGVNLDRLAHGALLRQQACLAVIPMGEPWRARFLVTDGVRNALPASRLAAMAEDCIQDAQQASDGPGQVQRLAVRLSTELFKLERSLPPPPSAAPIHPMENLHLADVAAVSAAETAHTSGAQVPLWVWTVLGGLAFLLTLGTSICLFQIRRLRRLKRPGPQSHIWILPEPEIQPRLGGAFSGGAGAIMHYRSQGAGS